MTSSIQTESVVFGSSYLDLIKYAYDQNHLVYITTITWLFKINSQHIDLLKLYMSFDVPNVTIETVKKSKTFLNQITLNFVNFSTKSIKIFKNGHVQVTGLSSYFECVQVSNMTLEWLNKFIPSSDSFSYKMVCNSQRIVMINLSLDTNINSFIILKDLCKTLNEDPHVLLSSYAPENHRGIVVKLKSGVSLFVFHTGRIIMTHSSILGLKEGYINMCHHFVNGNTNDVPIYKKNIDTVLYGYDIKDLMGLVTV
uniref:Uncharacterized protein n=1 Tax=viral metagenome TaxID=1070528 RepID=A0A6C0BPS3_9ZZZZ